jgi:hypothetical protein
MNNSKINSSIAKSISDFNWIIKLKQNTKKYWMNITFSLTLKVNYSSILAGYFLQKSNYYIFRLPI